MSTSNPKPPKRAISRRSFLGTSLAVGGVIFVMVAIAQSALAQNLVRFTGGIGVIPHWFSKYHGARRRSRWPDLGDPGPCNRREAAVAELKHGMEALAPNPKEQASQVQKVSDQLEMTKPAPQTALTN